MKQLNRRLATGWVVFFIFLGFLSDAMAEDLHIFVGAGLRQPVDQLTREFETRTGHHVFVDYGGSGQLLAKIQAASQGDLFIPGALFYIEKLRKAGKVRSSRPIVLHSPVIGVNIKQTGKVARFEDLAKPGVRLAMGDPKAMAFGRTALSICEKSGLKDAIWRNVAVFGATVKQLALYVSQGVVDAAIIGRSDAYQNRETITMVPIPKEYFEAETVAAAILQSAKDPDLAGELGEYLSSEHGVSVFQQYGFLPLER